MPWLPVLHTPEEDRAYFGRQIAEAHTWVAVSGDAVLAFAVADDEMLRHLYVRPDAQGRGVGTALLDAAIAFVGPGMRLWAFQRNEAARAFYRRRGLVEVELTDGAGNEERMPDVLIAWRPAR